MNDGNGDNVGRYEAQLVRKGRGDVEVRFEIDDARRKAIMSCLESGNLRMTMQDVDLDRLAADGLGGGYLWD